jgi:isopenicillin N synthase-like dioxygenase
MLTLLSTDENPGLQIKLKDGSWMDVPPKKDALIINLGDMLERWTNGV